MQRRVDSAMQTSFSAWDAFIAQLTSERIEEYNFTKAAALPSLPTPPSPPPPPPPPMMQPGARKLVITKQTDTTRESDETSLDMGAILQKAHELSSQNQGESIEEKIRKNREVQCEGMPWQDIAKSFLVRRHKRDWERVLGSHYWFLSVDYENKRTMS